MTSAVRVLLALVASLAVLIVSASAPARAQARTMGQVYLMRGIANMFSYGLDDLATKLRTQGIEANVYQFDEWQDLAQKAVSWSLSHNREPIVIIGHSLGADAAVHMAQRMTSLGLSPTLVITFDPVGLNMVQETGGRFINYYQSNNGFGQELVDGPGFTGSIDNRDMKNMPGINHFNLEKSPVLHEQVVQLLKSVMTRKARAPVPASGPEAARPAGGPKPPANAPARAPQAGAGAG
ncbi:hypothetical protein J5J86_18470 [Aquabacter sp. L1I39]|uniref:thioesterase domain-containing protein n=1 Tax=Aquabacter sp. L1I39 TaxID=2820278 RepID=UPI001ADCF52D|nr:thioesterase domain-containing protein [Aquabacter sp. L1I39]QTL02742.1 hypothetical protein J5J86_18470 [Aquabacter sp. L1I39]